MTEDERYFKEEWEEECYFFDPIEFSEEKVDEDIIELKIGEREIGKITGINISYDSKKEGGKMRNDNFRTVLRSQDVKSNVLSVIEVNCKKYETFKKIIDAVMPILEKEDSDRDD